MRRAHRGEHCQAAKRAAADIEGHSEAAKFSQPGRLSDLCRRLIDVYVGVFAAARTSKRKVVNMKWTALGVVSLLSVSISTCAWAADDVCLQHKPDPTIDARAKDLAIKLLDGQPSFLKDWNDYLEVLRKGDNAAANEAELAVDMHCKDPQDVNLNITPDGRLHNYAIDTWRIAVNNSVLLLAASTDVSKTLADVHASLNGNPGIPKESRDLFVADFIRDCGLANLPFIAIKTADGNILISGK